MVSFAHRNKVDTTPDKQGVEPRHDNDTASLPGRFSIARLFGRERPTENADKGAQSVTKTLGLNENASNRDVINALYKRYNRDHSAMYKGAQREFGIDIETLRKARHERFVADETAQGRGDARTSNSIPGTTRETSLQKFLQNNNLDGSSTNHELINKFVRAIRR
jgi:hypothetical protein